jgi:homospermidine synthase
MSAMKWMIKHPNMGFLTPEDLPYNEILKDCYKYLGRIYSDEIPIKTPTELKVANFRVNKKASTLD